MGAVAVGPSGRSHHGVNVENASYPGRPLRRARRARRDGRAGERALRCVAVAPAGRPDCLPCGLCLQALAEFGDPEIVARAGGELAVVRLQRAAHGAVRRRRGALAGEPGEGAGRGCG